MKQLRRGAAFLTALALLCTLTLPAAAAADTVTISSVQDFVQFSKQCTRDTWSQGITVELTADLDLSNEEITPATRSPVCLWRQRAPRSACSARSVPAPW